jgi:S-formylglutathione hydrolase FrmB
MIWYRFYLLLLLVILPITGYSSTVDVIKVHSQKMNKDIPVTLIRPDSYANTAEQLPVLYLLHGAGGDYRGWNANSDIAELADLYNMIVVCPDGGRTSWYFDSPIDPKFQYESFVAKDCVEYIDKNYRSRSTREGRAICGLSMGGHGAIFLGIRHKDVFSIVVVMSGGVDIRPFPNSWDIKKRLGDITTHRDNWDKYTVINLAKELKDGDLAISIDCGDRDFFLKVNRALHQQLLQSGINHKYIECPGVHNWKYWKASLKRQMPFIDSQFKQQISK